MLLASALLLAAAAGLAVVAATLPRLPTAPVDEGFRWQPPAVHLVDATGDAGWDRALGEAIAEWGPSGLSMDLASGPCQRIPGTVVVCLGTPLTGTATTAIYTVGAPPLANSAVITVQPEPSATRRQSIACHELGHAIGFGHEASGCMQPTVGGLYPTAADLAALRSWYPGGPPAPSPSPPPSPRPAPQPSPARPKPVPAVCHS